MRRHRACLRADFRQYYGVAFEEACEKSPLEAADLFAQLPRGSRTLAAIDPPLAWTQEDYMLANIANSLMFLVWAQTKDGAKGRNRPQPIEPPKARRRETKRCLYPTDEYARRLKRPRRGV